MDFDYIAQNFLNSKTFVVRRILKTVRELKIYKIFYVRKQNIYERLNYTKLDILRKNF